MDISTIIPHIEALIFASEKPLTSLELTELINNAFGFMEDKINLDQIESAIEGIIEKYAASFYPFEMKESGGGWQFLTKKDYHKTVAQLNGEKFLKRLSAASLETLAIVAYKQPITKGEVESIRGVNSDYSIQKLLEKELIVITGRNKELPGKPLVYATSKSFMDYFGINSPEELPKIKEVFTDQGIEATVVKGREEDETETADTALQVTDDPNDDDVLLVVRGNGELIEEPLPVVDEHTATVDAEAFVSEDSEGLVEEINLDTEAENSELIRWEGDNQEEDNNQEDDIESPSEIDNEEDNKESPSEIDNKDINSDNLESGPDEQEQTTIENEMAGKEETEEKEEFVPNTINENEDKQQKDEKAEE